MLNKLKTNNGLTLIELLFTLAMFGVIVIWVTGLLINTAVINRKSEQQYKATLIAQSYMENIKASDSINIGETVETIDSFKVIVSISKVSRYRESIYKINIEVLAEDSILERLEGYKIITQQRWYCEKV